MQAQQSFDWDIPVKTHKSCTKCGETKALTEFYSAKGMRDGKRPSCKACVIAQVALAASTPQAKSRKSAYNKAYSSDPENLERIRANMAAYRADPENAELARQRTRDWYKEPGNLQKHKAWRQEYFAMPENQARVSERRLAWQRANREAVASSKAKRRAAKRASAGTHTRRQVEDILLAQKHCCASCEADLRITKKHLDHWMPLCLGGSNGIENLQWLCQSCNVKKSKKDPIQWLSELGKVSYYPRR